MWRIELFGDLRVKQGEAEITHFETRKAGALLAYMALFPHRTHPREVLAAELWPEEDGESIRNRLRQALSRLRRLLEGSETAENGLILADRNDVSLNPDLTATDVAEFEAAVKGAAKAKDPLEATRYLKEAVALYQGDLLPGYYEPWIISERERLAEVHHNAQASLARLLAEQGDLGGAVECARQVVAHDPLREDAHCDLIRLYLQAGRHTDAQRQFKEMERVLREELGIRPSSATYALVRSAQAMFASATSSTSPQGASQSAESLPLEPEGGAVPLDSSFYIIRPTDEQFQKAIAQRDSIVLVKGARQIGKTSLLARGLQLARESGAQVVLTDMQKFSPEQLESVETLFRTFAEMIIDQLELDLSLEDYWNPKRGWNVNFERFLRREVLGNLSTPLVWGLDEVDRLFGYAFSSVVFGLFRSWHNERSLSPDGPWGKLTLAISYATEAHLFITDLNQSPFNVGTRLTLEDFTLGEVDRLNRCYDAPLRDGVELSRYYQLVGGHPYLVRRGLRALTTGGLDIGALEAQADREDGVFGDHLRRLMASLSRDTSLCEAVRGVLRGQGCPTPESFYRLRSAGVVVGKSPQDAQLRCGLYQQFFMRWLP